MARICFKCGSQECEINLTTRDIHLLDDSYFLENPRGYYRRFFALDFIRGLPNTYPPVNEPAALFEVYELLDALERLLVDFETCKDLISWNYSYQFADSKERGGGTTGFSINGKVGSISVRPPGYCTATIIDVGPNGRGRLAEIIDMRVKKQLMTDRGLLKIYRRRAQVSWFDELPKLINFLEEHSEETVEIIHRSN